MMVPARRSDAPVATHADDVLSAMVIVRAASGRRLAGSAAIDASTLSQHSATPADVAATERAFRDRGFAVGQYVGISFAISAPRSKFEEKFGVQLALGADGQITVLRDGKTFGLELPLDRLTAPMRRRIDTVTFAPPVELLASTTMI